MARRRTIYVGCAGWTIPGEWRSAFPATGPHLVRYAARLPAVEINSSFYRLHRPDTYRRWAAAVPEDFRFAVKLSRQITHVGRLADTSALNEFLIGAGQLGPKLGPLLVQLPPSLVYDAQLAAQFFTALREHFDGEVVCEPRHPSWFEPAVEQHLAACRVARVAADPAPVPAGARPGGWSGLVYYRLHGSPRKYYSSYSTAYLEQLAARLRVAARTATVWCILDNTASGAATENALALLDRLGNEDTPGRTR